MGLEVILKKRWVVHRLALNDLRLSRFLLECEWAGVELVIGPKKFRLGCYWVQIQWAGSNFHTHTTGWSLGLCELMGMSELMRLSLKGILSWSRGLKVKLAAVFNAWAWAFLVEWAYVVFSFKW